MMLIVPMHSKRVRTVAEIIREFWASHCTKPDCTWKVNRGTSAGMDMTNVKLMAPLMTPTMKAAIIAMR